MSEVEVLSRCTRSGVTCWQAVAQQLGVSIDAARLRCDPAYLHARPWPHPCEPVTEDGEPDVATWDRLIEASVAAHASPHAKGPELSALILAALLNRPWEADHLAHWLCRPPGSIRAQLSRLRAAGLVKHDGWRPRLWSLTEAGRRTSQPA